MIFTIYPQSISQRAFSENCTQVKDINFTYASWISNQSYHDPLEFLEYFVDPWKSRYLFSKSGILPGNLTMFYPLNFYWYPYYETQTTKPNVFKSKKKSVMLTITNIYYCFSNFVFVFFRYEDLQEITQI